MTTWYITKYALSGGIKAIEGKAEPSTFDPTVQLVRGVGGWGYHHAGRDVFDTLDAAIADAEARRVKKIASLKKQITKLEKADFSQVSA